MEATYVMKMSNIVPQNSVLPARIWSLHPALRTQFGSFLRWSLWPYDPSWWCSGKVFTILAFNSLLKSCCCFQSCNSLLPELCEQKSRRCPPVRSDFCSVVHGGLWCFIFPLRQNRWNICTWLMESLREGVDWFEFPTALVRTETLGMWRPLGRTVGLQVSLRCFWLVGVGICKQRRNSSCLKWIKDSRYVSCALHCYIDVVRCISTWKWPNARRCLSLEARALLWLNTTMQLSFSG